MKSISKPKLVVRSDGYEQVVFAEVLIPDTPNVYGDFWTKQAIFDASVEFMRKGFGIDVEHDNVDRRATTGGVFPIASFIAREGDPEFREGSWVVGLKIEDAALWQDVLDNKINGFSYEAIVEFTEAVLVYDDDFTRTGTTEPDITDGHVHSFMVIVDENNRPVEGGTSVANGHSHEILTHTVTAEAAGHTHRFNLITVTKG